METSIETSEASICNMIVVWQSLKSIKKIKFENKDLTNAQSNSF